MNAAAVHGQIRPHSATARRAGPPVRSGPGPDCFHRALSRIIPTPQEPQSQALGARLADFITHMNFRRAQ